MQNRQPKGPQAWAIVILIVALIGWAAYGFFSAQINKLSPVGLKTFTESNDPHATKILFIGNSFTYTNNVPGILAWMLKNRPKEHFQIESFALPSYSLKQHMQKSEIKDLLSKRWDYIILQEKSGAAFHGEVVVRNSFEAFLPLVRPTGAKTFVVMTWADRGQFANECIISQTYRHIGQQLNLKILPVGDLFFYVQEKYPQVGLYLPDCHHPDVPGAYLYALTVYAQIFGNNNLPTVSNQDKSPNTPVIKLEDTRELSKSIREWQSILNTYPEFREEAPNDMDIAYYWAMNGRAVDAEALCLRRLDAVNRLFPLQDNVASADAFKQLADAEYMFKTPEKITQAYENYAHAETIYKKTEGPNSQTAAEIAKFMQEIKPYIKP